MKCSPNVVHEKFMLKIASSQISLQTQSSMNFVHDLATLIIRYNYCFKN